MVTISKGLIYWFDSGNNRGVCRASVLPTTA